MQRPSTLYKGDIKQIYRHPLQYFFLVLTKNLQLHLYDIVTMKIVSKTAGPFFKIIQQVEEEQTKKIPQVNRKLKRLRKNVQEKNQFDDEKGTQKMKDDNKIIIESILMNQVSINVGQDGQINKDGQLNKDVDLNQQLNCGEAKQKNNIIEKEGQIVQNNNNNQMQRLIQHKVIQDNEFLCIFNRVNMNKFIFIANKRIFFCTVNKGHIETQQKSKRLKHENSKLIQCGNSLNSYIFIQQDQIIVFDAIWMENKIKVSLKEHKKGKIQQNSTMNQNFQSIGTGKNTRSKPKLLVPVNYKNNNNNQSSDQENSYKRISFPYKIMYAKQLNSPENWIILTNTFELIYVMINQQSLQIQSIQKLIQLGNKSRQLQLHVDNTIGLISLYDQYNIVIFQIDYHLKIQKMCVIQMSEQDKKNKCIKKMCFFKLGVNTSTIDRFHKQIYVIALELENTSEQFDIFNINIYNINRFGFNLEHKIRLNESRVTQIWSSQYLENSIVYVCDNGANQEIKMFNVVRNWAATNKKNERDKFGSKQLICEWVCLGYRFQPLEHNEIYQEREDEFDTKQSVKARSQEQTINQLDDWSHSLIREEQFWKHKIQRLDFSYQFYDC